MDYNEKIPIVKLMDCSLASGAILLHKRHFEDGKLKKIDYTPVKGSKKNLDFKNTLFIRYFFEYFSFNEVGTSQKNIFSMDDLTNPEYIIRPIQAERFLSAKTDNSLPIGKRRYSGLKSGTSLPVYLWYIILDPEKIKVNWALQTMKNRLKGTKETLQGRHNDRYRKSSKLSKEFYEKMDSIRDWVWFDWNQYLCNRYLSFENVWCNEKDCELFHNLFQKWEIKSYKFYEPDYNYEEARRKFRIGTDLPKNTPVDRRVEKDVEYNLLDMKIGREKDTGNCVKCGTNLKPLPEDHPHNLADYKNRQNVKKYILPFIIKVLPYSSLEEINTPLKSIKDQEIDIKNWIKAKEERQKFEEKETTRFLAPTTDESLSKEISELIEDEESIILEKKSTLFVGIEEYYRDSKETNPYYHKRFSQKQNEYIDKVMSSISAFANTKGGNLLIGVNEKNKNDIIGIETDIEYGGIKDVDEWTRMFYDLLKGIEPALYRDKIEKNLKFEKIGDKNVVIVKCPYNPPSKSIPMVYYTGKYKKKDGIDYTKQDSYKRRGPSSEPMTTKDKAEHPYKHKEQDDEQ